MKLTKDTNQPFRIVNQTDDSGCGCATPSGNEGAGRGATLTDGSLTIEGQEIQFTSVDKNLVDIAARANISIPTACYRSQ